MLVDWVKIPELVHKKNEKEMAFLIKNVKYF